MPEREFRGQQEQSSRRFLFKESFISLDLSWAEPSNWLNLGVHYYYQIDTVVLLQTGIYKQFFDAGQAWCSSNIRLASES